MTPKEAQVPPFHLLLLPPLVWRVCTDRKYCPAIGCPGPQVPPLLPVRSGWAPLGQLVYPEDGTGAECPAKGNRFGKAGRGLSAIPTGTGPPADTSPTPGAPETAKSCFGCKDIGLSTFQGQTLNFHLPDP